MSQLIKYSPTSNGTMVPDQKGNWYLVDQAAQNKLESAQHSLQQLNAEIASYADRLFELSRGGGELMPVMGVVKRLLQLSSRLAGIRHNINLH